MTAKDGFEGFPEATIDFLTKLSRHNNKEWFDAHRDDYERYYLAPAREFVVHLGEALREIAPEIHAEPAINKSIFRINRDIRFSKDKTPYKTHLAIFLWEGAQPRMECPGFYFHLEPPNLMLGNGIHTFSKLHLEAYRDRVAQPKYGKALSDALRQIAEKRIFSFGSERYKRVPSGFDPEYPYADLLLNKGLTVAVDQPIPDALYSQRLIEFCLDRYREMSPIHFWLREMVSAMG
jgi:uncharacterized protein (TIGR02453 family)